MAHPSKAMATGPATSHSTRTRTDRYGLRRVRIGSILSHDRFSTGRPARSTLEVNREEPAAQPRSPYSTTSPATATTGLPTGWTPSLAQSRPAACSGRPGSPAAGLTQAATHVLRVGLPVTVRCSRRALGERSTCTPRPRITARSAPEIGTPFKCPAAPAARPNVRDGGRETTKYPQEACFMTSFEVTTTSVAREVTLYLALAYPSSSRRALPGSIASSPSVRRWIRSGPASGPPQG